MSSSYHTEEKTFIEASCTNTEAATGGVLQEKMFLEISQNSQENIYARTFIFTEQVWTTASANNIPTGKKFMQIPH